MSDLPEVSRHSVEKESIDMIRPASHVHANNLQVLVDRDEVSLDTKLREERGKLRIEDHLERVDDNLNELEE